LSSSLFKITGGISIGFQYLSRATIVTAAVPA
jgi:hypothetical protein